MDRLPIGYFLLLILQEGNRYPKDVSILRDFEATAAMDVNKDES